RRMARPPPRRQHSSLQRAMRLANAHRTELVSLDDEAHQAGITRPGLPRGYQQEARSWFALHPSQARADLADIDDFQRPVAIALGYGDAISDLHGLRQSQLKRIVQAAEPEIWAICQGLLTSGV